jgi:tetratricopeptide (TPR) repeat protein
MGSVFQAEDMLDGRTVALKFMHATADTGGARRFVREARLLAGLHHPGIVAHVAHGLTESGLPFLAMEWLEGEDLAQRLAREPLSLEETLRLMRRVAEALSVAHARGVIHRDLKPSNLFLRQKQAEAAVILDFGLARHQLASQVLTGSAMLLGTPRYMAPEQASSQKALTPSADIFSLGCVLYECLTGQPPFEAPHLAAVLAKILFAEPPPLCHSRPELPPSLQVLMDRMLAKDPNQRLPDAMGLLDALVRLDRLTDTVEPKQGARTGGLTDAEQRLVSVLLVVPPREEEESRLERTLTLVPAAGSLRGALLDHLHESIPGHGGRVAMLADGSLLLTLLPERDTASDQALLAARCALSIKERWPQMSVVLSTGRGLLGSQQPVGEVMDRAGQLLRQCEQLSASSSACPLLDEVTAGLLGPGFELTRLASGAYQLRGEHLEADASRLLLGRPTTCVGREQELAMLELAFGSCVEDSSARALLVLAPAGMGKSRLRHEFLRRLEKQGKQALLMLGRGDPMRAGSAYGLLGQAVRRLCGIQDTAELETGREKLRQRVGMHPPAGEARTIVEFLGELCGIPFPEENSPGLRTARADPRAMNAQVGRALVSFLRAECSRSPVLLVLEDLHWGDARSVHLIGEALRALSEHPLLVLALARPEVKELFPGLWGGNQVQEVALRGLSRKAGARLVREVLGAEVSESVIERMMEQAAGNALFLEEFIRMAADGRGEEPPATVLAMLQGRIQRLEPGVRQVLLAASFFGRTFWSGGVKALLDSRDTWEVLEQRMRQLVELEVVERLPESRFPSEVEYRFRHVLVRDAAQGLVLDDHKPTGHLRVGAWLEQMGEPDPLVLAEHYQLGRAPERAIPFYVRAAEQLLERYDCQATLHCVEAGLACGAGGAMRTRLRALQALVFVWMDDLRQAYDMGSAVLPELKPGSLTWCRLAGPLFMSSFYVGRLEEGVRTAQLLLHTQPEPDAIPAYLESLFFPVSNLGAAGLRQQAAAFLARMVDVGSTQVDVDVLTRAWVCNAQGCFGLYFEDTLWQSFSQAERAASLFRELGLGRNQIVAQTTAGMARAFLGDISGAVELLRDALDIARQAGEPFPISYVQVHLALMQAWSPEERHREAARVLALDWLKEHAAPNPITKGVAHTALAKVALARGAPQEAEDWARGASELLSNRLSYRLLAHIILSESLLTRGQLVRAREEVGRCVPEWEQLESGGFAAIRRLGVLAEVCFAQGDTEAGESALKRALRYLRTSAEDLPDPAFRARFLNQVPENARVLELARLRWGEAWSRGWASLA